MVRLIINVFLQKRKVKAEAKNTFDPQTLIYQQLVCHPYVASLSAPSKRTRKKLHDSEPHDQPHINRSNRPRIKQPHHWVRVAISTADKNSAKGESSPTARLTTKKETREIKSTCYGKITGEKFSKKNNYRRKAIQISATIGKLFGIRSICFMGVHRVRL